MSADYLHATSQAYWLLTKHKIEKFPLDIIDLIDKYKNVSVLSYSELSKASNLSFSNTVRYLGSKKGACAKDTRNCTYIIFYNDAKGEGFSRFTIAHELGHITLSHHDKYDLLSMNKNTATYKQLEKEADCFARNLLSPVYAVYNKIGCMKCGEIERQFRISAKAAETRNSFYEIDCSIYRDIGYELGDGKKKHSLQTDSNKRCTNCGNYENLKKYKHCIICNNEVNKNKHYKAELRMRYSGLDTTICPRCKNEEIEHDKHIFCIICRFCLVNFCTNDDCEIKLPSNARYCYKCGANALYLSDGSLKEYDDIETVTNQPTEKGEPVSDDSLPF